MKKQVQPQRGTKMHKEGVEPLITRMKRITERRADFLGLKISAPSASSAVKLFSASLLFLWLLVPFRGYETDAFSPSHIRQIRVICGKILFGFRVFFCVFS